MSHADEDPTNDNLGEEDGPEVPDGTPVLPMKKSEKRDWVRSTFPNILKAVEGVGLTVRWIGDPYMLATFVKEDYEDDLDKLVPKMAKLMDGYYYYQYPDTNTWYIGLRNSRHTPYELSISTDSPGTKNIGTLGLTDSTYKALRRTHPNIIVLKEPLITDEAPESPIVSNVNYDAESPSLALSIISILETLLSELFKALKRWLR